MNIDIVLPLLKGQYSKKTDEIITIRGKDHKVDDVIRELNSLSERVDGITWDVIKLFKMKVEYEFGK